jgi:hypothetical protein
LKKEVLGRCPVCDNKVEVSKISCRHCDTHIEGHFSLCKFCQLTKEQRLFVEVFIKNRGNIKEIEKELGISYPTVRGKLENVIESMGYRAEAVVEKNNKKDVLEKLSRGEITTEEAIQLIKD